MPALYLLVARSGDRLEVQSEDFLFDFDRQTIPR